MGTGNNQYGQLSVPVVHESIVPIQSKFGVREVAGGGGHTMFLMWDGTVWGVRSNNNYGQLGDGTTTQRNNPVQVLDSSGNPFNGVAKIAAGKDHNVLLKTDGSVWTIGWNAYGQLGDGTNVNRGYPVQVLDHLGNPLIGIVGIGAGDFHLF